MSFQDETPPHVPKPSSAWRATLEVTPEQRSYFATRDEEIGEWLSEISELIGELLADAYHQGADLEQLQYLHARVWKMRRVFGFTPKATGDEPQKMDVECARRESEAQGG